MSTYVMVSFEGTRPGGQVDIVQVYFNNATKFIGTYAKVKSTGAGTVAPSSYIAYSPDIDGSLLAQICGDPESDYRGIKYSLTGKTAKPFAEITEEIVDSPDCPYEPQPGCDLIMTLSRTDETGIGADNGTVTARTESTFDSHEYSIDGGSFVSQAATLIGGKYVSEKVYTGLTPKSYFIRVQDSNECLAAEFITVQKYLDPIVSRPALVQGGNTSRWSAAFNPVVFNFKRVDYDATVGESSDPDSVLVYLNTLLTVDEINAAITTPVTVKGTAYDLYAPAISHQVISGQSVLLVPGIYSSGGSPAVFVNTTASKPNYKLALRISSGSTALYGYWSPDKNGDIRADISVYLKNLVSPFVKAISYTVEYKEIWDGNEGIFYSDGNTYYATYSAMQLGEKGAGNMVDYVGFAAPDPVALWLTKHKQPIYWPVLPFEISFIRDVNAAAKSLQLEIVQTDVNGTSLLTSTVALGLAAAGIYSQELDFTPEINAKFALLRVLNTTDSTVVTETKKVAIEQQCTDPYIYLKWINQLGGWDYYRFGYSQNNTLYVSTGSAVKRNVTDWQNDNTIWDAIQKQANKRVQFGATNIQDISGLEWLPVSIKVMLLVAPDVWQTVELIPGSFNLGSTRDKTYGVQFSINLPEINIQTQ